LSTTKYPKYIGPPPKRAQIQKTQKIYKNYVYKSPIN